MYFSKKLKNFLTLGTANLAVNLMKGIFWIFLASLVSKTEDGELGYLMGIVTVTTTISLLGFRQTIMVYESKKQQVFYPSLVINLISTSIGAVVIFIFIQNIFVSLLIMGMAPFELILSYFNSQKRYKDFSKYIIFRTALMIILSLIFYKIIGLNGIFLGYFIPTLLLFKDLPSLVKKQKLDFSILKSKVEFILNSFANRIFEVLFGWGDKIIIGSLFGFNLLGSYHFAAQYFLLIEFIPRSIYQYLVPEESEGQKNKNIKKLFVGLTCVISLISIVAIPHGVNFIIPEYEDSIIPMQIMSIALIPMAVSSIQTAQLLGKEFSRIVLFGSILQSGSYIIFILLLGPSFGIIGIAFGLLISVTIKTLFLHIFRQ
jgi:O-antigen/teichoic acid export membrane protein